MNILRIQKFWFILSIVSKISDLISIKSLLNLPKSYYIPFILAFIWIIQCLLFPIPVFLDFDKSKSSIYVANLIINHANASRINASNNYWGNILENAWPGSHYEVFSTMHYDNGVKFTYVQSIDATSIFSFIFPFIKSLENFVKFYNQNWYLRTTEDVYIDIFRLKSYIAHLETKYNPNKDIIYKGHLVGANKDHYFIHGGPGWLLSRAAAVKLLEFIKKDSFKTKTYGDDAFMRKYMDMFHMNRTSFHSSAFFGFPLSNLSIDRLMKNDFSNLEHCKENVDNKIENIIIWHSGTMNLETIFHGAQFMKRTDPHIYTYTNSTTGEDWFCYDEKTNRIPDFHSE